LRFRREVVLQRALGESSLLIDTYSVFFRAFYALPPMNTSAGEPTSALYGFSVLLLKVLRERKPTGLAFAVDAPQRTFRHNLYSDYKGQREAAPSALVAQLRRLEELLRALAVPVFSVAGFEADDVLASLTVKLSDQPSIVVLSGDRDLLQLVSHNVRVEFIGARGRKPTIYDEAAIEQRFQIRPNQLPSWTALVGDPSDNIPAVPGVGPRTASALIRKFESVGNLLEHLREVAPAKLRETLTRNAEQIRLNEELARLRVDVPLGAGPFVAPLQHDALEGVRALFVELEFKSLEERLSKLANGN
jgi:DNA polymerase I